MYMFWYTNICHFILILIVNFLNFKLQSYYQFIQTCPWHMVWLEGEVLLLDNVQMILF